MKRRIVTRMKWKDSYRLGHLPMDLQAPLPEGFIYHTWPAQITSLEAVGIGTTGTIVITVSNEPFSINPQARQRISRRLRRWTPGKNLSLEESDGTYTVIFRVHKKGFCVEALSIVISLLQVMGIETHKISAPKVYQETEVFMSNKWLSYGEYLLLKILQDLKKQQTNKH